MTEGPYKLPEGWRWVRLGEVCQHRTGIWGPEASDHAQGFPIVRSTEIEGFFIRPQAASVRMVRPGQIDAYKLETGDILVSKSSGSPHLVGWPAIFEDPHDGRIYLFSNFMLRLRSDRCSLEPWFLLYYLHSPTARSVYLGAQNTTSGLRNLRVQEFMAHPIPLPPLEEQRRIVARIDALIERIREAKRLRQQAKEDAERLWQSALAETFPRLGTEPPPGWCWVRLGEVFVLKNGKFIRKSELQQRGSIRVYGSNGLIGYITGTRVVIHHDTIVIGRVGTCGAVNWALAPAWVSDNAMYVASWLIPCEPHYIVLVLKRANLGSLSKQGAQPSISQEEVYNALVPLPPLEEQRQIVAHLEAVQEKVKTLKEVQAATEAELQRLEQAILDRAFRGEL